MLMRKNDISQNWGHYFCYPFFHELVDCCQHGGLANALVGIMPPLIYGFSFRESNSTEYKLIAVAAAGLLCISLLAIGKAHVKPQKAYIKYLLSYLSLGVSASGLSYVAGLMISRLLEKLGLFDSNASVSAPPSIIHRDISSTVPAWASY